MTIPSHKKIVVIGGGIVGCSLFYHLACEGWADSLLIEKDELTSGSTWHAAGAITHSLGNAGLARMAGYGIELYQRTAYAVWTGIGAIGTFLAGIYLFGDSTAIVRWLGVALIAGGGIVALKLKLA